MLRTSIAIAAFLSCFAASAFADLGSSATMITPIFSQLVRIPLPRGFQPVFENVSGGQYINESVLDGETVKQWTQMITITGAKGLASNARATPEGLVDRIAGGFRKACPNSFNATALGASKISGYESFGAIVSCGIASPSGTPYSESMLLIVLKGDQDYYTIQWAERGPASNSPIKVDDAKWAGRMRQLSPIKLCPIIQGERPPYVSCRNGGAKAPPANAERKKLTSEEPKKRVSRAHMDARECLKFEDMRKVMACAEKYR
jgi:hypothetical protein